MIGRADAPMMLVMTSPQGPATLRWLFEMMADDLGVRKTDCSIVHVIEEAGEGQNGKPTAKQVRENMPRLREEIALTCPKVIVALGPDAVRATTGVTTGLDGREGVRGYALGSRHWRNRTVKEKQQVGLYKAASRATGAKKGDPRFGLVPVSRRPALPVDYDGYVVPTYGVETVEDMGYKTIYALKSDIEKAVPLMRGVEPAWDEMPYYHTSLDGNGSVDYTTDLLAFDIETAGIGSSVIERISLSDGERTHTLPWDEATRVWCQRQFDLARDRGALLVAHNMPFDIPLLAQAGCVVPTDRIFDTMFGAVNLQPDLPKGLGNAASLYLTLRTPWKWRDLSEADPAGYSAADSWITATLARREIALMREIGWYDRFVNVIMQRIPVLMDLNAQGVRVHVGALGKWSLRLQARLQKYHRLWGRAFPGVNPSSAPQLKALLYKEWGLPVQRTKTDRGLSISTDELACVNLREYVRSNSGEPDDPWKSDARCTPRVFDLLLAIRREQKELRTYAKVRYDSRGRIYPSYLPAAKDADGKQKGAAATGRLASHGPNFQNQSAEATRVYIPDYDDFCFVSGDYKGAELYVLGALSSDRAMLDALKAPGGIHTVNMKAIGCEKRTAKAVMFGTCYGAGAPTISNTIKKNDHIFVPVAECKRVQQKLYNLYPDAFSYLQYRADLMLQDQCLTNKFGRTRFFYGKTRDIAAAKDYDPQSTVADIVWEVLLPIALMARRLGGRLTTTVHDQFLVQVHRDKRDQCVAEMREIMERRFDNVAPGFYIPVDFKAGAAGASWYDLEELQAVAA